MEKTAYWYHNPKTDKKGVYGSLKALAQDNDIEESRLYYFFSRKKATTIWLEGHRVYKTTLKTA